ncbi:MAG: DUF4105 domain-containing protein [Persicimonas sp.]
MRHSLTFARRRLAKILGCVALVAVLLAASAPADAYQPPPWGTGQSDGEDLVIKLVTFSPGDQIVSWFGHTALVVEDQRYGQDRLYNYGMFSFGSDMLFKFAMGRLWFWVGEAPVEPTYDIYKGEERDVRIQTLDLPPEKRLQVAEFLAHDVLPENREYLYHHYDDNCSTRVRDIIDEAVDGQLKEATSETTDQTFRDHTRRHAAHNPPMDMLLMFLMNDNIDESIERWDEMFLPEELEAAIDDFEYTDQEGNTRSLVAKEEVYYESSREPVPEEPPAGWPVALLVGLAVGGGAWFVGRRYFEARERSWRIGFGLYNALVGLVIGVPGLMLFLMWLITEHKVTHANENLLLGNPLTLLVAPLGVALALGSERADRWLSHLWGVLAVLGLALVPLKLLPWFDQNNALPLSFILPILLGFGWVWWRHRRE